MFLKVLLFSIIIIAIVMAAFGVKLLFSRNGSFTYSSCNSSPGESCGCGATYDESCKNEESIKNENHG